MKAVLILTLIAACCEGLVCHYLPNRAGIFQSNQERKQLPAGRGELEYRIRTTWDSMPVLHRPVTIAFRPGTHGLLMEVNAPFFDDPPAPPGPAGQPFNGLWEYEVVESFLLNSKTKQYLEVELCPHGQHLVLLLSNGNAFAKELSLQFEANITGNQWNGTAVLPWEYFPPGIDKMNSYAIHGSGIGRIYEALYSIPLEEIEDEQGPNFHRLEYFKPFDLKWIMGDGWEQPDSALWKELCCNASASANTDYNSQRKAT
ncbi:UPF0462 protein C4orf33 homolog [Tamandua tetradactyla]|uniref:UPF0462 protein C4orf33 homolog n=1 Tax=Tamandua tetradactyla TaxID=48850 RepID=UPI004054959D